MSAQTKTRALIPNLDPTGPVVAAEILAPGTPLMSGQYVIEKHLSSGGFGITYFARDSLNRRVVIKECYPESLCSRQLKTVKVRSTTHINEFETLVRMFVREAGSLAQLNHPNIVGVHQVFEDNETAYMALDLIEGQDLMAYIRKGDHGLSPKDIRTLLMKLLDAIGMVHGQDMLHRDISPDNILVNTMGEPVLIDFGAAREHASQKSRAISALLVVKDGYSPQEFYMSGGQQGPSSDLYSLAATFHHLITGAPPPVSQERLAAMAASQPDPYQPLFGRIGGYSEGFLKAIDKAMAVLPADRIQSADEWLSTIEGRHALADEIRPSEIERIVSRLVFEVGEGIDEDKKAMRAAPTEPVETPEPKVLEDLSHPDVSFHESSSQWRILSCIHWVFRCYSHRSVRLGTAAVLMAMTLFLLGIRPLQADSIGSPGLGTPIQHHATAY